MVIQKEGHSLTPQKQLTNILENIDSIVNQYCLYHKPVSVKINTSLDYDGFALSMSDEQYRFTYGRKNPNAIILAKVDPRQSPQIFKQELTKSIHQLQHKLKVR